MRGGAVVARNAIKSVDAKSDRRESVKLAEEKERLELIRAKHDEALAEYMSSRSKPENYSGIVRMYIKLGDRCYILTKTQAFENFILGVIVVASIMISLETYKRLEGHPAIALVDYIILSFFTMEVVFKILGETLHPWVYFTG
jgi:hypothetical protein